MDVPVPEDLNESELSDSSVDDPEPKQIKWVTKEEVEWTQREKLKANLNLKELLPNITFDISYIAGYKPFKATCKLDIGMFEGRGQSKRKARKACSLNILAIIKENPDIKLKAESMISKEDVIIDKEMHPDPSKMYEIVMNSMYNPMVILQHVSKYVVTSKNYTEQRTVPNENPIFSTSITVDGRTFEGSGSSKKSAKDAAACRALEMVGGVKLPLAKPLIIDETASKLERLIKKQSKIESKINKHKQQKLMKNSNDTYELPPLQNLELRRFSNCCRLWIGNLPKMATADGIKKLFEPYGDFRDFFYDQDKQIGSLTFDYKDNAVNAKYLLNNFIYLGNKIMVRFSSPGCSIRVKNLSPWVTNELLQFAFRKFGDLEKAVIITNAKGNSTGEGIIQFQKEACAVSAIQKCTESLFILTASPRPVIVEPMTAMCDGNGMEENDLNKNNPEFRKEHRIEPRFAEPDTFEEYYGIKWREIYENYEMKLNAIDKELLLEEKQLLEQMPVAQFEHETTIMKIQVEEREEAIAFNYNQRERRGLNEGNFSGRISDFHQHDGYGYGNESGTSSRYQRIEGHKVGQKRKMEY